MNIEVGRIEVTYLVPCDHPQPERVRHKLDVALEHDITHELTSGLKEFTEPHDGSIWFVRRIDIDLAVDVSGMPRQQLGTVWAAQITRTLEAILRQPVQNNDVRYYKDRGAYVVDFIIDLVAGRAWGKWYYETFAGLRHLPPSQALREAIVRESTETSLIILRTLKQQKQLEKILAVLQESDAQRIVHVIASATTGPLHIETINIVSALWARSDVRPTPRWVSGHNQLRLWATWLAQSSAHPESPNEVAHIVRAIERLLQLTHILLRVPHRERLIALLQQGALGQATQFVHQHGLSEGVESLPDWSRLAGANPTWFDDVVRVVAPQPALLQRVTEFRPQVRGTLCGSLFVLLRDLVELGLHHLLEKHAPGMIDGVSADAVWRYWLLLKCWGGERLAFARHDWAVLLAAGLSVPLTDELWSQFSDATSPEAMAALQADFVTLLIEKGRATGQFLALDTVQRVPLVRDMTQGYWLALGDSSAVAPLIETALFAGKIRDAPDVVQDFVEREKPAEATLQYHSLPNLPPHIDQTFTLLAQAIMRAFARRLIGFAWSSPEHLYHNFLLGHALLTVQPEQTTVALPEVPLKLVLRMAGLQDESYTVPWLDDHEIVLKL